MISYRQPVPGGVAAWWGGGLAAMDVALHPGQR
jgi:hypothetical protein